MSKHKNEDSKKKIGGVLHTYTKFDPIKFPSPTQPPPDIVSPLMNQMMSWGSPRPLTEEELANAIRLNPEQFKNLGPSLDVIKALLEDRKRKILETYESKTVQLKARKAFRKKAKGFDKIPQQMKAAYKEAVAREQLYDLENLWYRAADDGSELAQHLMGLMARLGDKYQIDELASKWYFTGIESLTIEQALAIKEELEKIEELLKQVEQAAENAQLAVLDMDQLGQYMDEETMHSLEEMKKQIDQYVEEIAAQQGLNKKDGRYELTPKAVRTFQNKLLSRIFSHLKASNSGRHEGHVQGEGAVELQQTKPYEFGDSIAQMDIPQTFINALIRDSSQQPIRLKSEDIEIHRTRNNPKAATVIVMDMSGSMRYDSQYVNVKRMAMAMDGLIRSTYPGDYLNFIEMYTFGKLRRQSEIIELLPKPVTIQDPFVQLKVDMSRPEVSEHMVHQHFTNIQHSLKLARTLLSTQNTPNRQVMLITDGLPTAHFEGSTLYMLYPPHQVTEQATMREAMLCAQEGITINTFLVPSWSQSEEDIRFAHRLSASTKGRVFFTAGGDLDRFVVWDYIQGKREIL